jgi:sporulation protein YlmC with PRC-barrel domain
MTRTEGDFLGLEVISLEDSAVVGVVDGLLIDERRNVVAGLVLDTGIFEANAVAYADVRRVEDKMVFVASSAVVHPLSRHPVLATIAERDVRIVGEVVLDDGGDVIGVVRSYSVDPEDGAVVSLEITPEEESAAKGYMLPLDEVIRIGRELIIVRRERLHEGIRE